MFWCKKYNLINIKVHHIILQKMIKPEGAWHKKFSLSFRPPSQSPRPLTPGVGSHGRSPEETARASCASEKNTFSISFWVHGELLQKATWQTKGFPYIKWLISTLGMPPPPPPPAPHPSSFRDFELAEHQFQCSSPKTISCPRRSHGGRGPLPLVLKAAGAGAAEATDGKTTWWWWTCAVIGHVVENI